MTAMGLVQDTVTPAATRSRRTTARKVVAAVPVVIFGLYVVAGLVGPFFVEYSSVGGELDDRLLGPGSVLSDGSTALLGTDALGRDLLGQVVHGARTSLVIGTLVVLFSGLVGITVGCLAGYRRGKTDLLASRVIDVLLAFPGILLAIVIAGVFDRSLAIVVIALSVTNWIGFARLSRSMAMTLRERDWVLSATVMGVRRGRIIVRHILPFIAGPTLALATTEFAGAILAEASLSFLGLGLPPESASWGQSIASGKEYLGSAWWISAFPGIFLAVLVICVGFTGDRLTRHFGRKH
ncbi:peptide/nickel transport system permease protein [Kribbella amoyensis]|uniref:Peptide/nickel transport system permease protein n=1 Tax=Kribbella amoyensis TaxID=996641 RepID=A0A561BST1_9ACTN|nr:ABC transporter permease [Kribbella amoyensis]TWD81958.1 peptide/nickel transport system permease protein [Kribbella amoyensis]